MGMLVLKRESRIGASLLEKKGTLIAHNTVEGVSVGQNVSFKHKGSTYSGVVLALGKGTPGDRKVKVQVGDKAKVVEEALLKTL